MTDGATILVLVHPGSACGSADFNLGAEAAPLRDALAAEVAAWDHDILVVDGSLSGELDHYAALGLAVQNAGDRPDRRVARQMACAMETPDWVRVAASRFAEEWPGGPHDVVVTGAWTHEDGTGCVDAVVEALGGHRVVRSGTALAL